MTSSLTRSRQGPARDEDILESRGVRPAWPRVDRPDDGDLASDAVVVDRGEFGRAQAARAAFDVEHERTRSDGVPRPKGDRERRGGDRV